YQQAGGSIGYLPGNGDGTFGAARSVAAISTSSYLSDIALVDIDRNGTLDVLQLDGELRVVRNLGGGTFESPILIAQT
ncbi:hypothetical protein, partial [Klebsiella pneumoniae]